MTENPQSPLASLAENERATVVMVHTANTLSWGHLITKKAILAERFLIGATVPEFISLFNVQTIAIHGSHVAKPIKYDELNVPYEAIVAFHLMPPAEAQLDYDPSEPNRLMIPFTAHTGSFHFNAKIRVGSQTSVQTLLGVAKSDFISIYDVEICHPSNPNMKPMNVNFAMIRRTAVMFGLMGSGNFQSP